MHRNSINLILIRIRILVKNIFLRYTDCFCIIKNLSIFFLTLDNHLEMRKFLIISFSFKSSVLGFASKRFCLQFLVYSLPIGSAYFSGSGSRKPSFVGHPEIQDDLLHMKNDVVLIDGLPRSSCFCRELSTYSSL